MLLSKRLKELRLKNNLTQKELGDLVNVTKVSICCYENGTRYPTLETIINLAECLKTDVNYLLGNDKVIKFKDKEEYIIMSKEEVKFIIELRKNAKCHNLIIANPTKILNLITNSLK